MSIKKMIEDLEEYIWEANLEGRASNSIVYDRIIEILRNIAEKLENEGSI